MSTGDRSMSLAIKQEEEEDYEGSITTEEEWKLRVKEEPSASFYEGFTTVKEEEDVKVEPVEEEDLVAVESATHFEQDPLDISNEVADKNLQRQLEERIVHVESHQEMVQGPQSVQGDGSATDSFVVRLKRQWEAITMVRLKRQWEDIIKIKEQQRKVDEENVKKWKNPKMCATTSTAGQPSGCNTGKGEVCMSSYLTERLKRCAASQLLICRYCKKSFTDTSEFTPHVREHLVAERLAAERLAAERLAAERLAAEHLAAERLAAERLAAERFAAERLAAERLAAERLAAERLAAERLATKRLATESLATERLAADQFLCHVCGIIFSQLPDLTNHLNMHSLEIAHKCHICGVTFRKMPDLMKHAKIHSSEKTSKCHVPDEKVSQTSDLSKPLQMLVELKPQSYLCHVCGNIFNTQSCLSVHLQTHAVEKRFSCELCSSKFANRRGLAMHMIRTHTGENSFECRECKKRFCDLHALILHVRTHADEQPFACKVCKRKFSHQNGLSTHLKIHTEEMPYSCSVCKRRFRHFATLKTHVKIHER